MKSHWLILMLAISLCAGLAFTACGDDDDDDDDSGDDDDDNNDDDDDSGDDGYSCEEICTTGETCGMFEIIGGGYDYNDCISNCETDPIDDCGIACFEEYFETEDCAVLASCMIDCYGEPMK